MAKEKTIFICQGCGYSTPKWLGRCPGCAGWNMFSEERAPAHKKARASSGVSHSTPVPISAFEGPAEIRTQTGIEEFDRVLGGGMVPGGCVLVGGDPGIGKSTLLLQAMGALAKEGRTVLYVSGEESVRQIRMRAERLKVAGANLLVWTETSVERIAVAMEEFTPDAVVVDSIQTLYCEDFASSAGSVGQIREAGVRLISAAKTLETPLFFIGHVTKDGSIAGPRVLEHMVDTVLYFEGKLGYVYRVLRAVKNRYGSVMEIGVFEMKENGLMEVKNPSEVFLAERPLGSTGSCVVASLEGTRTLLAEIQALTCAAPFGAPRRTVVGMDYNRVILLVAVLEKKAGIGLSKHDIFVKVAGGIKIEEPAADLAVVASLVSNFVDKAVDSKTVVFGEVGLAGEVRAVTQPLQRIKEAAKLGFKRCVVPRDSLKGIEKIKGMELIGAGTVKEAMDAFFG